MNLASLLMSNDYKEALIPRIPRPGGSRLLLRVAGVALSAAHWPINL